MSLIFGYIIIVNMVSFVVLYFMSTKQVKDNNNNNNNNTYLLLLSFLGGSIGLNLGSEMFGIMVDNKIIKFWSKFIFFLELCAIFAVIYITKGI